MSIYIIAEIGINHNGDIDIAKSLIQEAKLAGCDAVKFQKRDIGLVYKKDFLDSYRDSPWGNTQRDQKQGLELTEDEYLQIDSYSKALNIDWFASAWDIKSQNFLKNFNCKKNKIASAMIIDTNLLTEVAKEGKHTYISTGMSEYEDIKRAVDIFRKEDCSFELMHCRSTYPMKDDQANLGAIKTLREEFKCDVGYSGHESGLAISYAASALGITSLERHITLDRAMYGSDQAASIEPSGLRQLVGAVRKIESAIGNGVIDMLDEEVAVAQNLRQHIK